MNALIPLILCGGAGTRLWPASRVSRPKQFLPLFGSLSTFQETIKRVSNPALFGRPVVIASHLHRFLVAEQLAAIGLSADILLEPEARDSGPAIAAGAAYIAAKHGDHIPVLALAADHMIRDVAGFGAACAAASAGAEMGRIVTFGIKPTFPATGYGYIEPGEALTGEVRSIRRFVEKPDEATATRYCAEGYLWNSGNFLFQPKTLLGEYAQRDAATVEAARKAVATPKEDLGFLHIDAEAFAKTSSRSIDYAVMEHTKNAAVLPASFDWSDVGSWDAVRDFSAQDSDGNAIRGDAVFVDSHRNIVATDGPLVSVVGLNDLAVIATDDAILVTSRQDATGVKSLVDRLKVSNRNLTQDHVQSYRPWGHYRSLDIGDRYQVKRIVVKPGGRLSLQKHHHRAEHWIVVRGTAAVTIAGEVKMLHENESVFVPIGSVHRMENPGKIDLEIIEVQTGSYLGEDDIIRIEDNYNRSSS